MDFALAKRQVLARVDKSSKGSVDKAIVQTLDALNVLPQYYTTSSCAGRIMLIAPHISLQKNQSHVLFCSHEQVTVPDVTKALEDYKGKRTVWLRCEAFILHVASRSLKDANSLLMITHNLGLKRSGITSLRRNIVEILSTEKLDAPVMSNKKLLLRDFSNYVQIANGLLARTHDRLAQFTFLISSLLRAQ